MGILKPHLLPRHCIDGETQCGVPVKWKSLKTTDTGQVELIRYDKEERYQDQILEYSFGSFDNKLEAALKNSWEDLVSKSCDRDCETK